MLAGKRIRKFDKRLKKQIKRFGADMRSTGMTEYEWNRLNGIGDYCKTVREEIFELLYLPKKEAPFSFYSIWRRKVS